jgi:hypothetical protein
MSGEVLDAIDLPTAPRLADTRVQAAQLQAVRLLREVEEAAQDVGGFCDQQSVGMLAPSQDGTASNIRFCRVRAVTPAA